MAHALTGHDGPCKHIHGHSYVLSVTVSGKPQSGKDNPKNGMVIDFADLKKIVQEEIIADFDHTLVLNEYDKDLLIKNPDQRVKFVPFAPTCEMMLAEFLRRIQPRLPHDVHLFKLRLDETHSSYAEWFAADNL